MRLIRPTYQRALSALLSALICTLALSASARAGAPQMLVVRGAGDGHGVGMSQAGARGFAEHGYGYRDILAHYYSGTTLGSAAAGQVVRVLVQANRPQVSFSGATAANGHRLRPATTYVVTLRGNGVVLRLGHRRSLTAASLKITGHAPLTLHGDALNGLSDGAYRGYLEVRPAAHGGINAINVLRLDDYVRGVIASEMPPSWPAAALQAQAVASRTFAITAHAGPPSVWDVYADTRSQLYRGVAGEQPAADAAARATAGQVVTYGGQPAITYFFDSSGGRTENVENAFPGTAAEPWLRGVPDPFDSGPMHSWGPLRLTFAAAAARLSGLAQGAFEGIEVLRRGFSPRIITAEVLGSGGATQVTGDELAARLGLYDTWAYFSVQDATGEHPEPDASGAPSPAGAPPPSVTASGGTPAG